MNQQKRATFEDVCAAQDILDDLIEKIIEENKPLNDIDNKKFKKYFRVATLGLGSEFRFLLRGKKGVHDLGNAGHAARWLLKQKKNPIMLTNPAEKIELKECWNQLWDVLDKLYDPALETSIKISKEQTHFGTSEPGMV